MDKNKAINQPVDGKEEEDKSRRQPDEVLNFINRSSEFIKDLMEENKKLRYRVVQLQEENRDFLQKSSTGCRADILKEQIRKLENEKERILAEYQKVEKENKNFASRYVDIEEENNNLAHLYVCSFQLHSTLNFAEVVQIIMEIVINLIGAEEFGILLIDEKTGSLKPVSMEGIPLDSVEPVSLGRGIIGKAVQTGENYFDPSLSLEQADRESRSADNPLVCVPLKIKERPIGAIVLYKLLPQKTQFANVDYELFTLLAGHAATAIFSAQLYTEAQRKLDTIKGFMELLTSS